MSVADDLKEREQAAGNAETGNIGQSDYDEKFNKIAKDTENEDFDDIIKNNYGDDAADEKVDTHGDKIKRNYNADEPDDSREDVKDQEENPDSLYNSSPDASKSAGRSSLLGKRLKKLSPMSGVIGLILFAIVGVSGGTTTLASSLLVNIKEMLHSDRADGTRANQVFSKAAFAKKVNYSAAGCGKVAIKCRMGTMNDSQIKNYEKVGFKIDGQIIGPDGKPTGKDYTTLEADKNGSAATVDTDTAKNRYIVKQITFPDGKVVTSGDGFYKYTKANVQMRAASIKAFNPRSAFFLNNRFTDVLGKTFGFSKGKVLEGKTKPEIDKSFNEKTGGATEEEIKSNAKSTKTEEEAKKVSDRIKDKAGGATTAAVTGACLAYNLSRYGIASVKIARMYELVSFALPWLQAADQIKDGGVISPEVVDNLSSRLTSYQNNKTISEGGDPRQPELKAGDTNPKYNLNATDSQGYKLALGDRSKLKDFAKTWLLGGNKDSTVSQIQNTLTSINSAGGIVDSKTGGQAIRLGCKLLNSPQGQIAGIAGVLASCISSIVGNEATGPQSCAVAVGWLLAGSFAISAINILGQKLINYAAQEAANNLNLGSDLNGVDAGDAMAAGTGLMLGAQAVSSGLRPSTSITETQQYIASTESVNDEYIAAEQYNARDTPFDVYNQYSFLGSIVSKIQPTSDSNTPLFSTLTNMTSIFSAALSTGSDTASALYSQPSFTSADRYDGADQDLQNIGVIGDKFGSIATIMPNEDLTAAQKQVDGTEDSIDEIIEYMTHDQKKNEVNGGTADDSLGGDSNYGSSFISSQPNAAAIHAAEQAEEGHATDEGVFSMGRSVDDEGKPIAKSQYSLYLKYCTDGRLTSDSQKTWDDQQGAGTYWGTSKTDIEQDSNRDQDWFSGKQCTHDSKMMQMFRQYTNYCMQTATMDGTNNCWNYDGATQSLGNVSNSECSANGDTKAIYTCALKYDNYRYKWGGGHGDVPNATQWIADFKGGKIPEWTPILDCSGLVRMAYVEAMGTEDQAYTAPGGYDSSKNWQKIPLDQAQQGDIVTSSGHVAIVEANDPGAKEFKIFDAETENGAKESNIRHSNQSYSGTIAAYRAKKG